MKKGRLIFGTIAILVLFISFILAETTFFQPGQDAFVMMDILVSSGLVPVGGSVGGYGEGYNFVHGTYLNTTTNDGIYYVIGRDNPTNGQLDLKGYTTLDYDISSLGTLPSKITSLKFDINYCYSRDVSPPIICQAIQSGVTINSANVSLYNFTSGTYQTIGTLPASNGVESTQTYSVLNGFSNYVSGNIIRIRYYADIVITQNGRDAVFSIDYAPLNVTFNQTTCTPNMVNTTWSNWMNLTCAGNQMNQSRQKTQYDSNNCGTVSDTTYYEYQLVGPIYYNTTGSWTNISCLSGNVMNQTRSIIQQDIYSCKANQTFYEYRATEYCDYCTPNMINATKSGWSNLSCSVNQMNQSRFWTEYDSNNCGEISNRTYYEYQLTGPTLQNSSWSSWMNISCIFGDVMNQSRYLTQFDIYSCAANQTFFEYRATEYCDYCTPNLVNITGEWTNLTCLSSDLMNQTRATIQYDSNNCGKISNTTFNEYRTDGLCDYDSFPSLVINSPISQIYSNNNIQIDLTSNGANVWFYNGSANVTYSSSIQLIYPDGAHTFYAYANDNFGNLNKQSLTFTVDTATPIVDIVYPGSVTYGYNITSLDYIVSDNLGLNECWYSLDYGKTNTTITCGENLTNLTSFEGINTWKIFAKDNAGWISEDTIIFNVNTIVPCAENWINYTTECESSNNQTKYYLDSNHCGIFGNLPADNGTIESCEYSTVQIFGGGKIKENITTIEEAGVLSSPIIAQDKICNLCFKSLQSQVKETRNIVYTSEEIALLTLNINNELKTNLPKTKVESIVTNFETECDRPLPLLAALATGRYKNITNTMMIIVIIILSIFLAFIAFKILSWARKRRKLAEKTRKNRNLGIKSNLNQKNIINKREK